MHAQEKVIYGVELPGIHKWEGCKMSQNDVVLQYLRDHGRITTYDAFRHGITRLSARIWDLKHKRGVGISKHRVDYKARDGKRKHFDVYKLEER